MTSEVLLAVVAFLTGVIPTWLTLQGKKKEMELSLIEEYEQAYKQCKEEKEEMRDKIKNLRSKLEDKENTIKIMNSEAMHEIERTKEFLLQLYEDAVADLKKRLNLE